MEGRIDMGLMRISDIPRNEDLLILWSYPLLKEWRSEAKYTLSGITLLIAKPKGYGTGIHNDRAELLHWWDERTDSTNEAGSSRRPGNPRCR
jgi:hypothetical protein